MVTYLVVLYIFNHIGLFCRRIKLSFDSGTKFFIEMTKAFQIKNIVHKRLPTYELWVIIYLKRPILLHMKKCSEASINISRGGLWKALDLLLLILWPESIDARNFSKRKKSQCGFMILAFCAIKGTFCERKSTISKCIASCLCGLPWKGLSSKENGLK